MTELTVDASRHNLLTKRFKIKKLLKSSYIWS